MEFRISDLLEVYRKRLNRADDDRHLLLNAIHRVSGVRLKDTEVSVKKTVIHIHSDSVTKNHLFLFKTKILEEISLQAPNSHISDIV